MVLDSTKILEELVNIYSQRYTTQNSSKVLSPKQTIRIVDEALLGQDFEYDPTSRQHKAIRAQMYAFATDYGTRIAEYNEDHLGRYMTSAGAGAFLGLVITRIATHSTPEDPKDFMTLLLGGLVGAVLSTAYTYFSIKNRYTHAKSLLLNLYSERLDRISRGTHPEAWEIIPKEVEAIVPLAGRDVIDIEEAPRALTRRGPTLPKRS